MFERVPKNSAPCLATRPNISECHSEISTRVPFCITQARLDGPPPPPPPAWPRAPRRPPAAALSHGAGVKTRRACKVDAWRGLTRTTQCPEHRSRAGSQHWEGTRWRRQRVLVGGPAASPAPRPPPPFASPPGPRRLARPPSLLRPRPAIKLSQRNHCRVRARGWQDTSPGSASGARRLAAATLHRV